MTNSISKSFKQAIKTGTGKAILLLKDNPAINLDEEILNACTHNLAYDAQCEGSRSTYLFEILSLAQNKEKIEDQIIEQLKVAKEENWDTDLLFKLAEKMALNGSNKAKNALYERYSKNISEGYEYIDTDALVSIDGLRGLEFCAEIQGEKIELDSEYWVDNGLIELCDEQFPNSCSKTFLEEKARENKYIKIYLSKIKEMAELWSNNKRKKKINWSYLDIKSYIDNGKLLPLYVGKWLNENDLLKLALDFTNENDTKKQLAYLRLFSRIKYPHDVSEVIPFIESTDTRTKYFALLTLSKVKDKQIRKLIDDNYQNLNYLKDNLKLFTNNYSPKDIQTFISILSTLEDEDDMHSFGMSIEDILNNNSIEKPSMILNQLYKMNNCSICRESIIKLLISKADLSENILNELQYDSNEDIRKVIPPKNKGVQK
jgi:hypothetical protein